MGLSARLALLCSLAVFPALAQQPTQEMAVAGRIQLEVEIAELRGQLTPEAKIENPVAWAMDEISLAKKLTQLGEWEPGTQHLAEAAEAYRLALSVLPCDQFATICGGTRQRLDDVNGLIKQRGK